MLLFPNLTNYTVCFSAVVQLTLEVQLTPKWLNDMLLRLDITNTEHLEVKSTSITNKQQSFLHYILQCVRYCFLIVV